MLLTDGLVDLPGGDGSPLGYDAVRDLVAAAPAPEGGPLGTWLDELLRRLVAETVPADDVTLLALRAR